VPVSSESLCAVGRARVGGRIAERAACALERVGAGRERVSAMSLIEWCVLRNDLLPPRYPVCGLWLFQVPGQFGRSFRPPAEFGLGARY